MTCVHGLDEINCPICRIDKSSVPQELLKINNLYNNDLKPYKIQSDLKPFNEKDITIDLISRNNPVINQGIINPIMKPNLINQIPNFKNKLFLERLEAIDIIKSKNYGIKKKIELTSPELKLKKEE